MKPAVSVIIPSRDRCKRVLEAIASVEAQTLAASEIIVVDDGSSDDTSSRVAEVYPHVVLITQARRGVSSARNRGIEAASGEWLAFLDSDDRWYANKLERQLAGNQTGHGCRLLHCDEHWFRNGKRVNPGLRHQKQGGWIFSHCLPLCVISPSAAVLHRSLLDDVGGFDESLPACEDYDLWLRVCAREPVHYVDEPLLAKTGGHDDQLSHRYPRHGSLSAAGSGEAATAGHAGRD